MFFVTLCPIRSDYYFDSAFGWSDVLTFFSVAVVVAIPIGVFVFWWRNFVTGTPAHGEAGPSEWFVLVYLVMLLITFSLGILAFEAVHGFG